MLAPPRPAYLVEVAVHHDPAHVGVHRVQPGRPRPRGVQLRERGLHDVLGPVRVAAEQVRRAVQLVAPARDVLAELAVTCPAHLVSPSVPNLFYPLQRGKGQIGWPDGSSSDRLVQLLLDPLVSPDPSGCGLLLGRRSRRALRDAGRREAALGPRPAAELAAEAGRVVVLVAVEREAECGAAEAAEDDAGQADGDDAAEAEGAVAEPGLGLAGAGRLRARSGRWSGRAVLSHRSWHDCGLRRCGRPVTDAVRRS